MSHTPGPWKLSEGENKNNLGTITVFHGPHKPSRDNQICETASLDDARLISMAPDMIELAKEFVREWEATWVDPEDSSHLWVAIYREAKRIIREVNGGHKKVNEG